jgi:hypothetical protein
MPIPAMNTRETVEVLFASWSEYATRAGEKAGTKKAFSQSMLAKFKAGRKKVGGRQHRVFIGVRKNLQENSRESGASSRENEG